VNPPAARPSRLWEIRRRSNARLDRITVLLL
jgi:hypothetical protein